MTLGEVLGEARGKVAGLRALDDGEVTYEGTLDKNTKFNPMDSELVKSMEQKHINSLSLNADFYGYDGDGLVGYITGNMAAEFG
jgi:hypothetical protein